MVPISEVFSKDHLGRKGASEITLFKSVGVALPDIVAASLVLGCAR